MTELMRGWLVEFAAVLQDLARHRSRHVFSSVAIETTSWCNRSCSYCPQSVSKRGGYSLSEELIQSVFTQLGEMRFAGKIFLHLYNEPLLDKRIVTFVRMASEKCPRSKIIISSNGDHLDTSLMRRLISAGLYRLFVTQYDGRVNENVQVVQSSLSKEEKKHLSVRVQNVFQNNRGGLIEHLKLDEPLRDPCFRPLTMLVINAKGKVVVCCNDYYGVAEIGDVRKEGLLKIWKNKKFNEYRRRLKRGERHAFDLCRKCSEKMDGVQRIIDDRKDTMIFKLLIKSRLIKP